MTRIPILMYHSIDSSNSVVSISAETFAHHLKVLDDLRIEVISLASAIDALKSRSNIERKAVLTFDDGFENFYNEAFPILSRTKTPATVFLVSDYCGKQNDWPGQSDSVPVLKLMNWSQISELSKAGIEFAAHSRTHPDLTSIDSQKAEMEILGSRDLIQEKTGSSVRFFAYPYGTSTPEIRQLTAKHFNAALGTELGETTIQDDLYNLKRIDIYYLSGSLQLLGNSFSLRSYLSIRNFGRKVRQTFMVAN